MEYNKPKTLRELARAILKIESYLGIELIICEKKLWSIKK
jgi:hypothetical protein